MSSKSFSSLFGGRLNVHLLLFQVVLTASGNRGLLVPVSFCLNHTMQNVYAAVKCIKAVYSYMSMQFFAIPAINTPVLSISSERCARRNGMSDDRTKPLANICLVELSEDKRIAIVVLSAQGSETANVMSKG